jgi:hypothetical protein
MPQGGGRFSVEGSAPIHELVEAAKKLGFEAEGKTEVHIDIPETPKAVDPNHRRLQIIKATALICRMWPHTFYVIQKCSCMYHGSPGIEAGR